MLQWNIKYCSHAELNQYWLFIINTLQLDCCKQVTTEETRTSLSSLLPVSRFTEEKLFITLINAQNLQLHLLFIWSLPYQVWQTKHIRVSWNISGVITAWKHHRMCPHSCLQLKDGTCCTQPVWKGGRNVSSLNQYSPAILRVCWCLSEAGVLQADGERGKKES